MACLIPLLALFLNLLGAGKDDKAVVAVAANMQFAIREIVEAFEEETKQKLDLVIGSSGKLTAQIKNGAPFDIFLSADMKYPEELLKSGHGKQLRVYALGTLVLAVSPTIEPDQDLSVLLGNEIKRIAIADPALAPYGRASSDALKYLGLYEKVKGKLVFAKSIAQVALYLETGSVSACLISKSAALSPQLRDHINWVDVNPESYESLQQGVVMLQHGWNESHSISNSFYEFLFSDRVRQILLSFGYGLP